MSVVTARFALRRSRASGLWIACALVAAFLITAPSPALAQTPKTQACVWLNNPYAFTAFAQAYESFYKKWLVVGEDWFQAYEIGGSAPHPFLARPREDMGSVKGYVWARDVRCEIWQAPVPEDKAETVSEVWGARLVAKTVTFSEEGNAWTPPLSDGVLWEVYLAKSRGSQVGQADAAPGQTTAAGETWIVDDNSIDASVLSTGADERRPSPKELPRRKTPRAWQ